MINNRSRKKKKKKALEVRSRWAFATYPDPKNLRAPRPAWQRVPHRRRERPRDRRADPEHVDPMVHIVHRVRMVRHDMVQRRKPKAQRGPEEKNPEDDPVVAVGGARVLRPGVRVKVRRQARHPHRRQQVAVDAAGLVVQVQAAAEGFEVGVGDWPEACGYVFVVFGPAG